MILMALAHDISEDGKYLEAVRMSMDYMMGRNGPQQELRQRLRR